MKDHYATEAAFRKDVVAYAKEHGWTVYWAIDSPFKPSKGFPDLVLAKEIKVVSIHSRPFAEEVAARLLFRELKQPGKYLSPEQDDWRRLLEAAGQDFGVWRPRDWDAIQETLGEPEVPGEPLTVKERE